MTQLMFASFRLLLLLAALATRPTGGVFLSRDCINRANRCGFLKVNLFKGGGGPDCQEQCVRFFRRLMLRLRGWKCGYCQDCKAENLAIIFLGTSSVSSYERGAVQLKWKDAYAMDLDTLEESATCTDLSYQVFYAKSPFDYLVNGKTTTVEDILNLVDTEDNLYYVETPNAEFELSGLLANETYDILVTASCQNACKEPVYSVNRQSAIVKVATGDPVLQPGITNIVPLDAYSTTEDFHITFGGENNGTMLLSGKEMPSVVETLGPQDVVSGFASDGMSFLCSLLELVDSEDPTVVAWKYRTLNPTDVYEFLEFDESIGVHDVPSNGNETETGNNISSRRSRQLGLFGDDVDVNDVYDLSKMQPWEFIPTIDFSKSKNDKLKKALGDLKIKLTVKWQPDQLKIRATGKIYKDIIGLVSRMDMNFHVYGSEKWTYGFLLDLKVASLPEEKRVNLKKGDDKDLGVEFGSPVPIHIPIGPTGITFSFRPVAKPIINFQGTFNIGVSYDYSIRFERDTTFKADLNFNCLLPYICGNEVAVTDKSPGRTGEPDISSKLYAKGTLMGQLGFGFYLKDFGLNGLRTGDWLLELGVDVGFDLTISAGVEVDLDELDLPDFELNKFTAGIYLQPKISALKGLLSYTPGKIFYFTLLALPSVSFKYKDLQFCQGSDAVSVVIYPTYKDNGLIPNGLLYWTPNIAWYNVATGDWEMDGIFSRYLTVRLPKVALAPEKKPEIPYGDFHLRWTPSTPSFIPLVSEDEIALTDLLGSSFLDGFECCDGDEEHCPSGYVCENNRCVVFVPELCIIDEHEGKCLDDPFYCRGLVAFGVSGGCSPGYFCCVEDVRCVIGNIFSESYCIDQSLTDADCDLTVPAVECTQFGEDARCCIGRIPCNFGNEEMSGYCIDKSSDHSSCSNSLPHEDCAEFGDDVECCLDGVPEKTCVANEKYPGTCMTHEDCLSADHTPLNNYKGVSCAQGEYCCVDPLLLGCQNVGKSRTVYGTCLHLSACSDQGYENVTDYIKDDEQHRGQCTGEEDIQCCIDLHDWDPCGKEGVAGKCKDKDNCNGQDEQGQQLEPFSLMNCPGDSEIQCCAGLPTCKLGETTFTGKCSSKNSCPGSLTSYGGQDCPAQGKPWYVVCCADPLPTCQVSGAEGQCTLASQCDGILLQSADCPDEEGVVCCLPHIPCQVQGFDGQCLPQDACNVESVASPDCSEGSQCCISYPPCEKIGDFETDYSNGFPCDFEGFVFNRFPSSINYPQPIVFSDRPGLCGLRLTPDFVNPEQLRAVSAFTAFQFDVTNSEFGFSMAADYRIFGTNAFSADGLAFVIHQDNRGLSALGGPGRFLGVYGQDPIKPALVVELDTKQNEGDKGESNIQVTRVYQDGSMEELSETHRVEIRTHESGFPFGRLWVDYCGGGKLQVYVNSTGTSKPLIPQLATVVALGEFFSDPTVYIGFTAGTAVESDIHDVSSFTFAQSSTSGSTCSFDDIIGSCSLGDECGQDGFVPIHANLCPGDIGCCVTLPNCVAEGVDGKCMPHDDCTGVSRSANECPYDPSAVGCCIHKPQEFNYQGFPCGTEDTYPLDLNRYPVGLVYPQYLEIPGESDLCYIRLTQDSALHAATSAFANFSFAPDNSDYLFSMAAGYRMFGSEAGAADGLAFVIHQDDRGTSALGGQGGNLGVYTTNPIRPALVVELDTYFNDDERLDAGANHVHVIQIHENGVMHELTETPSGQQIRTNDTGTPSGHLWVEYCDDGKLRVFFNSYGDDKPAEPQSTTDVDLKQLFTGPDVFIGFASGTYLEGDNHDILSLSFEQSCAVQDDSDLLLRNGDFEESSDGRPSYWDADAWMLENSVFTWEAGMGVDGSGCIKIENVIANDARYVQTVTGLAINESYHISAMIKVESIDLSESLLQLGASVSLVAYSGWAIWIHSETINSVTADWVAVELDFVAQEETVLLGCRLGHFSSTVTGVIYCDNFTLTTNNSVRIPVSFYFAYVVPSLTEAPLPEDLNKLIRVTEGFWDDSFINYFDREDPEVQYLGIELSAVESLFDAGFPDQRFNYYVKFDATLLYDVNSATPPPDPAETSNIMASASFGTYILEHVRGITPPNVFSTCNEVRFGIESGGPSPIELPPPSSPPT